MQRYVRLGKAKGLQALMYTEAVQLERRGGVRHVRTSGAEFKPVFVKPHLDLSKYFPAVA